jgi:hypothetical protein
MVDVGNKTVTQRTAVAESHVQFPPDVAMALRTQNFCSAKGRYFTPPSSTSASGTRIHFVTLSMPSVAAQVIGRSDALLFVYVKSRKICHSEDDRENAKLNHWICMCDGVRCRCE